MKILRVHNHYAVDGGESAMERSERRLLTDRGHDVVVYERHNDEIDLMGPIGRAKVAAQSVWSTRSYRELHALILRERPDVAHFTNTFPLISPSAVHACRDACVPVVQSLHNYRLLCPAADLLRDGRPCEDCVSHSLWRSVQHACYRGSHAGTAAVAGMLAFHRWRRTWTEAVDAFVALSEFSRQKLVAGGLPAARLHVKPNFVDPDPGPREDGGEYVLYAGRLSPEKGLHTLLRGWQELRMRVPLRIAGDGPLRPALEAEARRAGLGQVAFLGRLPRPQLLEAIQRARFVVVPSECYENFPLAIAEAFACAVPVVASRLGALAELVDDRRTGLLFAAGDARALAEAVTEAWRDAKRTGDWGRAARAVFEDRYTADRNAELLIGLYERVRQRTR